MKLAYAVTEHNEATGGIIFATHPIAARIRGANEYADGEITGVSCRRAAWADQYAEAGGVPASEMVHQGWHFECHGCGVRIDCDLTDLHDDVDRYKGWTPDSIIGTDKGAVYCDAACKAEDEAMRERQKMMEERIRATYTRLLLRKLPGAEIEGKGHVYVEEWQRDGRRVWRIGQVRIRFDFPGRRGALAELTYNEPGYRRRGGRGIGINVSAVDIDAFNAWRNGVKKAA